MNIIRTHDRSSSLAARRGGALKGCLIALAILVVIIIAVGVWIAMSWKGWTANGINAAATAGINASPIPDTEKPELIAILEDLSGRFEDGDISFTEYFTVIGEVMTSDVFPIGSAYAANLGYIQNSAGLTDEEKADGATQMMRIAQGLNDGLIDSNAYEDVFAPMKDPDQNTSMDTGTGEARELIIFRDAASITDDQLREVIASAKTLADDAGVAEDAQMLDLSDLLQAEVDESLNATP